MLDQVMPAEDAEIAKVVQSELRKQNVKVVTGAPLENVEAGKDSVEIAYGGEKENFDYLCIAAGRDAEVVEILLLAAVGDLHRVLAGLDVLERCAGDDLDVLLSKLALDHLGDLGVLRGHDLVEHLDQHHLGPEAT